MAEFFKAAVKCDVKMAKAAPMYIDQTAVLEELYKHDKLVEQTLRTRLMLEQLDADESAAAATEKASLGRLESSMSRELNGVGTRVTEPYKEPAVSDAAKEKHPTDRTIGSREIQRRLENSLSLWHKKLADSRDSLKEIEKRETEKSRQQDEARKRDAERELNALVVSRQISVHEAQQDLVRQQTQQERSHRRVHPIDVLQKKIAMDILEETHYGAVQVAAKIAQDSEGIDHIVEAEQMRSIKFQYHQPSKHIPHPW